MFALLARILPDFLFRGLSRVLDYRLEMAQTDARREETRADLAKSVAATGGNVAVAQMQFKAFWIPWLIAAGAASLWYGWGMMDSLFNGALPDVAALPPQLERLTTRIFDSLFYSGAAMGVVQALSNTLGRK
ncbi:MAG: hypothetical protein JJ864_08445 [Rhizobiaceae bacterium]|nr:hypothetical protein [Rhizobiaceae bacterium]